MTEEIKTTLLSDWLAQRNIDKTNRREGEEAMNPPKYQMRYGVDYGEGIIGDIHRIQLLWELVSTDMVSIEDGQRIINNHKEEIEEYMDELIWRFDLNRSKLMNQRYAELKNFRKPMKLEDFADAYYNEKPFVHRVALTDEEMHNEIGFVASSLENILSPFPGHFINIDWKPVSILEEHVIFEVTAKEFVPDEEADLSKIEYYKPKEVKQND